MKILNGNTVYEFTVAQTDATTLSTAADEFKVEFRYRMLEREIRFPRNRTSDFNMTDLLEEFDVPETTRTDMAAHFDFYVDRLSRRNRRGLISVLVCLDSKEYSPERAAAIQRRMESGRRERERENIVRRVAAVEEVARLPAKKAVVEGLERVVVVAEEEERECSVCLEKMGVGIEGRKLPCEHVYHTECITRWLDRTHFCPICRFNLPF